MGGWAKFLEKSQNDDFKTACSPPRTENAFLLSKPVQNKQKEPNDRTVNDGLALAFKPLRRVSPEKILIE